MCIFPFLSTYNYYYDYFYVSGPGADKEDADNARDTIKIGICELKKIFQIYLCDPRFNLDVSWVVLDPRALRQGSSYSTVLCLVLYVSYTHTHTSLSSIIVILLKSVMVVGFIIRVLEGVSITNG